MDRLQNSVSSELQTPGLPQRKPIVLMYFVCKWHTTDLLHYHHHRRHHLL